MVVIQINPYMVGGVYLHVASMIWSLILLNIGAFCAWLRVGVLWVLSLLKIPDIVHGVEGSTSQIIQGKKIMNIKNRNCGVSPVHRELYHTASRIASRCGVSTGRVVEAFRDIVTRGDNNAIGANDLFLTNINKGEQA